MPKCIVGSNSSICKSFARYTNNHGGRINNFLRRWKRNFNLKRRDNLFMVKWRHNTKYYRVNSGKLYCTGNQCKRMPKRLVSSNGCNRKYIASHTNYFSRRINNFLYRRKCNLNVKCRINLFVVYRCNNIKYYSDSSGKL